MSTDRYIEEVDASLQNAIQINFPTGVPVPGQEEVITEVLDMKKWNEIKEFIQAKKQEGKF